MNRDNISESDCHNKTIVIVSDNKEKFIAEAIYLYLKYHVNDALGEKRINIVINERVHLGDVVLLLCSPYSVASGQEIHNYSGKIEYQNVKFEKQKDNSENHENTTSLSKRSVIVPICYSGITSGDLPSYIATNQGLTIPAENELDAANFSEMDLLSKLEKIKNLKNRRTRKIDLFGEVLLATLNRHLISDVFLKKYYAMSFFKCWDNCWTKYYSEMETEDSKLSAGQSKNYIPIKLVRETEANISQFIETSLEEVSLSVNGISDNAMTADKKIQQLSEFCKLDIDEIVTSVSIGIQIFLWDGRNLYLGLKSNLSDSQNRYYCTSNMDLEDEMSIKSTHEALFELGKSSKFKSPFDEEFQLYKTEEVLEAQGSSKDEKNKRLNLNQAGSGSQIAVQKTVRDKFDFHEYVASRLNSCGHQYWNMKIEGLEQSEPCILLVNDSDDYPRMDVGIIRVLDISKDLADTEVSFPGQFENYPISLEQSKVDDINYFREDWIWAKDGRIRYWCFKDAKAQDKRYLSPDFILDDRCMESSESSADTALTDRQGIDPIESISEYCFFNDVYLFERYGLCQAGTPYTSDEDRKDYDISVQEPFTVAARSLLICF